MLVNSSLLILSFLSLLYLTGVFMFNISYFSKTTLYSIIAIGALAWLASPLYAAPKLVKKTLPPAKHCTVHSELYYALEDSIEHKYPNYLAFNEMYNRNGVSAVDVIVDVSKDAKVITSYVTVKHFKRKGVNYYQCMR